MRDAPNQQRSRSLNSFSTLLSVAILDYVPPPGSAGSTKTLLLLSPSFAPVPVAALTLLKGFRPRLSVNVFPA